jgi:YggT family protein
MHLIFTLIYYLIRIYSLIIIIRAVLSFFPIDPYNGFVRAIYAITEPLLAPIRNALPASGGMDFSPLVLLVILFALQQVVTILAR